MPAYRMPRNHICSPEERQLFNAINRGDVKKVKSLMDKTCSNIHIECRDHHKDTPLWLAVRGASGNLEVSQCYDKETPLAQARLQIVKLLLERGADLEAENDNGTTPLSHATRAGIKEVVKLLLSHGANINHDPNHEPKYFGSHTPLSLAVSCGQTEIVRLMLQQPGANVDYEQNGTTLLEIAATRENSWMVELLLDEGASINHQIGGMSPLFWAIEADKNTMVMYSDENSMIFNLFLDRGADLEQQDGDGFTPLTAASQGFGDNSWTMIRLLLDRGANLEHQDHDGITPLGRACQNVENIDIARLLLDRGANLEHQDKDGITPLGWACRVGQDMDMVTFLLDQGANLGHQDIKGRTPLVLACINSCSCKRKDEAYVRIRIIRHLLYHGAQVDHQDEDGRKHLGEALFLAVNFGNLVTGDVDIVFDGDLDMVRSLLDHGAIQVQNSKGDSPLSVASSKCDFDMVRILLERGADIGHQDRNGRTPLFRACAGSFDGKKMGGMRSSPLRRVIYDSVRPVDCENGDDEENEYKHFRPWQTIQLLLEQGADVEHQDNSGRTPLCFALSEECAGGYYYDDIVFLLVQAMAQRSCDSLLIQLSQQYVSTQPKPSPKRCKKRRRKN